MICLCLPQGAPRWKLDLIRARAIRLGLRGPDLDDAVQEVALEALGFAFCDDRSNGASEATALTAVVDRRLLMHRRRQRRYQKRIERIPTMAPGLVVSEESVEPAEAEKTLDAQDVRTVVAGLAPRDQQICQALAEGLSIDAIAQRLGCGWHTIKRRVDRVRERFVAMGFDRMGQ